MDKVAPKPLTIEEYRRRNPIRQYTGVSTSMVIKKKRGGQQAKLRNQIGELQRITKITNNDNQKSKFLLEIKKLKSQIKQEQKQKKIREKWTPK